jgi:hypothetical protein
MVAERISKFAAGMVSQQQSTAKMPRKRVSFTGALLARIYCKLHIQSIKAGFTRHSGKE